MDAISKRIALVLLASCCLCTIVALARREQSGLRVGPTSAYAEPLAVVGSAARGQPRAAADPAQPAAYDPLAADPALSQPPAADPGAKVRLTARVDRKAVLVGSDGRVQVELSLAASDASASDLPRQPSDVLVVLDISGSMSGQKLAYAKRALHQLIGRLSDSDRFGLVTYESDARLVVPLQAPGAGSLARWHHAVDALETAGGTNMSSGLDLGLAQLTRSARSGRAARVLLLSDGHANEGDSSPNGLQSRARRIVRAEHVLTTMGIGDDFNEDLMTSLAEVGAGNFYYLSQVASMGRFFDAELRASSQTVARALELRIDTEPGSVVVDVSGYPIERSGNSVTVRPGNLFAGQKRTLWVTVQLPTARLGQVDVGHFSVNYKRDDKQYAVVAPAVSPLACVDDQASFERGIDRAVWEEGVTKLQYQKSQLALGKAISDGTAADVDRELKGYEANRDLASKLGSARVLNSIEALSGEASKAKQAQQAPAAQRNLSAKRTKAKAVFDMRLDAYNDDPLQGL